ncbi:MAG TPA: BLUF domain-containing protein [Solirubrobacteraceae bacterium]|nr:BLUF domain-containing protein [Solirubrobacteraceae bacterium]
MITIVYTSRAVAPMSDAQLTGLLEAARGRNAAHGVTGMLLYAYESFMQQLEGDDAAVNAIYASIAADPRHTELRLLSRRPIRTRRYDRWAMGFEHPDAPSLATRLPGYHGALDHPLAAAALVPNAEIAETLLEFCARTLPG